VGGVCFLGDGKIDGGLASVDGSLGLRSCELRERFYFCRGQGGSEKPLRLVSSRGFRFLIFC
tara:strand:- start:191 stop:376 length:186 start_codon:yes stop_codon:yes gene_type:complete